MLSSCTFWEMEWLFTSLCFTAGMMNTWDPCRNLCKCPRSQHPHAHRCQTSSLESLYSSEYFWTVLVLPWLAWDEVTVFIIEQQQKMAAKIVAVQTSYETLIIFLRNSVLMSRSWLTQFSSTLLIPGLDCFCNVRSLREKQNKDHGDSFMALETSF